jgi:integrase
MANMFNIATNEWRWLNGNPMKGVKRPKEVAPRQRVITQDEIDRVVFVCGDDYSTAQGRVGAAFLFAVETAMRAGEICNLTWRHIHAKHAHLPTTKNGSIRDVPLSAQAKQLIEKIGAAIGMKDQDKCFCLTTATLDALFRRARDRALVVGITFHDSRALALTRLSKILNIMQLARVSGHRDLSILQNVYFRESVTDIAALLDPPKPQSHAGTSASGRHSEGDEGSQPV